MMRVIFIITSIVSSISAEKLEAAVSPATALLFLSGLLDAAVLVLLIDEGSSSDAEVAAYSLRHTAQATLVGARTWGGVFGCGETSLVDGTSVTHPTYAMHVHGAGWAIENHGVEPDVAVAIAPHDAAAGGRPPRRTLYSPCCW